MISGGEKESNNLRQLEKFAFFLDCKDSHPFIIGK